MKAKVTQRIKMGQNTAEGRDVLGSGLHKLWFWEVIEKTVKKAVRLTAWVDPPPPEAVRKM